MSVDQQSWRPYLPEIAVYIQLLEEYLGQCMPVDAFARSFCGQRDDDAERAHASVPAEIRKRHTELWEKLRAGEITLDEMSESAAEFWPFEDEAVESVVLDAINQVNSALSVYSSDPPDQRKPYELSEEQLRAELSKHLGVLRDRREAYQRVLLGRGNI